MLVLVGHLIVKFLMALWNAGALLALNHGAVCKAELFIPVQIPHDICPRRTDYIYVNGEPGGRIAQDEHQ